MSHARNALAELAATGQSPWLDQLRREWTLDGTLARWIADDDLRGLTSNPAIFQAAVADSAAYDAQIAELAGTALAGSGLYGPGLMDARMMDVGPADSGLAAAAIFDALTLSDIRAACDVFLPVWERTGGLDGYISHEVAPELADDTAGTVDEARRLWAAVARPNVMIKIPATPAGITAIRQCLTDGININITLMFSLCHYDAVADAYLGALERRQHDGLPIDHVASVASFFVSRVDSWVDSRLDRLAADGATDPAALAGLRGQAAIANAKRAYCRFQHVFGSTRFERLARHGARVQRVLWASTSAKDPAYDDLKYVTPLIGPDTVNTLPLATYEAMRDHGRIERTLDRDVAAADAVVMRLAALGIDLEAVGEALSREGVAKFVAAQAAVVATVAGKM